VQHDDRTRPGPVSWDQRFAGDEYLFGTDPNQFLVSCRGLLGDHARVLCLADGEGRNSVWLAAEGFDVVAFDASQVAIEKARRLASSRGVRVSFELADADRWRWPEAEFDVCCAIFIQFAPPPLRRRLFDRIAVTLRPGGLFLLEGYRTEQLAYGTGGPPVAELLYTETQLRAELAAFELERLAAYDAVIEEGAGHSGMSALIDVVCRRPAATEPVR
jgi:SAM-dependent methyltransferase